MEVSFIKGESYKIITPNKHFLGELNYVRREEIPSTGEEWETFYTSLGGYILNSSEGLIGFDGVLVRARIPVKSILGVVERTIVSFGDSSGDLVTKLIQDPENRTPLVESWIKEVEKMTRSS